MVKVMLGSQGEKSLQKNAAQAKEQGSSKALGLIYAQYAILLDTRSDKTNDKNHRDAAFGEFDKAISLDPKNTFAYNNRGYAYLKKGDFDRAIADFNEAIGLDPKLASAYLFGQARLQPRDRRF